MRWTYRRLVSRFHTLTRSVLPSRLNAKCAYSRFFKEKVVYCAHPRDEQSIDDWFLANTRSILSSRRSTTTMRRLTDRDSPPRSIQDYLGNLARSLGGIVGVTTESRLPPFRLIVFSQSNFLFSFSAFRNRYIHLVMAGFPVKRKTLIWNSIATKF